MPRQFLFSTLSVSNPIRFQAVEDRLSQQHYDGCTAEDVQLLKEKKVNFLPYAFLSVRPICHPLLCSSLSRLGTATLLKGLQHALIKQKHGLIEGFSFFIFLEKGYPGKTSYDYFPYILKKLFCIGIKLQSQSGAATWHNDRLLYQSYLWTLFTEAPQKYLSWQLFHFESKYS